MDAGRGARFAITNPETLRVKMDQYCDGCSRWKNEVRPEDHEGRKGHTYHWRIRRQDYPELFAMHWDSIIADECDRYLLALRPHTNGRMPDWGEGMIRLAGGRKIAMTGTPFHGSEINLFGILHWLDPQRFSAFWTHVDQYFDQVETRFGREITGLRAESRQAYEELLDLYTLRRTKLEAKPDLPDELHQDHLIDMTPVQRKQYEEFEELGWTRLEDDVALRSGGLLAQFIRLQQLSFGEMMTRGDKLYPHYSEKYEWLLAALSERGIKVRGVNTGHMKYVIVSQFTFVLDWISEQFQRAGIKHLMITGKVTGEQRGNAIALFQSCGDPHRVMLLNTKAGGVSIDLDAWCDEMFILDETDIEDQMEQVRGRINNRGERVAPRTFHYLRTANTIQERMADKNLRQALMQHKLLDGRRGLELAARLLGREV
jgi:SNF2 family DNA or RNA helicase